MAWSGWFFGVSLIAFTILSIGLLWRMHSLRHDFEIASRSPQLVIVSASTAYFLSMTVLLHWTLVGAGLSLPCWAVIVTNYICEMPS